MSGQICIDIFGSAIAALSYYIPNVIPIITIVSVCFMYFTVKVKLLVCSLGYVFKYTVYRHLVRPVQIASTPHRSFWLKLCRVDLGAGCQYLN